MEKKTFRCFEGREVTVKRTLQTYFLNIDDNDNKRKLCYMMCMCFYVALSQAFHNFSVSSSSPLKDDTAGRTLYRCGENYTIILWRDDVITYNTPVSSGSLSIILYNSQLNVRYRVPVWCSLMRNCMSAAIV